MPHRGIVKIEFFKIPLLIIPIQKNYLKKHLTHMLIGGAGASYS
jgi:hypothetical protein